MKTKRFFLVALSVALALHLSACGNTSSESAQSGTASTTAGDGTATEPVATESGASGTDSTAGTGSTTTGGKTTAKTTTKKTSGKSTGTVAPPKPVTNLPPLSSKVTSKTVTALRGSKRADDDFEVRMYEGLKRDYGITVEDIVVPYETLTTQLIQMISAKKSPDIYFMRNGDYPNAVASNLFEPVDDLIDVKGDAWKEMRDELAKWKWKGKTYLVGGSTGVSSFVWYNTKMFKAMGLKDPLYYYDKGEWDWNKLVELAKVLTQDKNQDGKIDQWGFGGGSLQFMLRGAVNEDYVKITPTGIVNNMRSANVAKAENMLADLYLKHKVVPPEASFDMILNNKLAMGYFGHWFAFTNDKTTARLKSGDIGFVPAPKAPGMPVAYYGFLSGKCIPRGAKNPHGAAAVFTYERYYDRVQEETSLGSVTPWMKSNIDAGWTKDMVRVYEESQKALICTPIYDGIGNANTWAWEPYTKVTTGTPWATVVEEYAPKMDAAIALMMN